MCHYYFMRLPAYQWVSLCYSTFVKTNIEAKGTKTNSKSKELKLIVFFILIWKLAYTHISKSSCLRAGFFVDECKFHNFSHSFSLFLIFYSHSFPIFPIIKSTNEKKISPLLHAFLVCLILSWSLLILPFSQPYVLMKNISNIVVICFDNFAFIMVLIYTRNWIFLFVCLGHLWWHWVIDYGCVW